MTTFRMTLPERLKRPQGARGQGTSVVSLQMHFGRHAAIQGQDTIAYPCLGWLVNTLRR